MSSQKACCAHCFKVSNINVGPFEPAPICHHCQKPMFTFQSIAGSPENFDALVKHTDIPVVVDFWASWCSPCVNFGAVIEQAAASWEPRVRFVKVNAETYKEFSDQLGIRNIPAVLLYHKGEIVVRQNGAMPINMFDEWLEKQVNLLETSDA